MNQSHIRIIPLPVRDLTGTAKLDLPGQGVPPSAMLVPQVERTDAVAHITRTGPNEAQVKVTSYGRTIAPMPWDGLSEPITVRVMAAWNIVNEAANRTPVARSWQLPAAMEHIIRHNMGTRHFVESISADGQAIFAGVTIIDEDRIKIELTEAQPVSVSIVFLT